MILYSDDDERRLEYDRLHLDEDLEKSPCMVRLYNIYHIVSVLLSLFLVSNAILLKYKKFDYIKLDDNLLLGFLVIGMLYFVHSLFSLSSYMKKQCLKSRCLYFYYVVFLCEVIYFGGLYGSHKEYYNTIELKIFTISMVGFHFLFFILLICVKCCMKISL